MNQNNDTFPIHAYGKSELALLYFPTASSAHTAVNHLMSWIKRCTGLLEQLRAVGYQKTAKFFTPREVGLIVEYLGCP
ncbi:DUF4248 domain-containing protein [Prevotella sp. AGR2160]|uniref:DUF4248 domain-containing protein n=1 Tax=Prevotella sp. AGR2160 TaxID=1280674 RepID=UPI000416B1D4|nr:DUF4248 domain-containing protein [Prevotella sp. AGR2160]